MPKRQLNIQAIQVIHLIAFPPKCASLHQDSCDMGARHTGQGKPAASTLPVLASIPIGNLGPPGVMLQNLQTGHLKTHGAMQRKNSLDPNIPQLRRLQHFDIGQGTQELDAVGILHHCQHVRAQMSASRNSRDSTGNY